MNKDNAYLLGIALAKKHGEYPIDINEITDVSFNYFIRGIMETVGINFYSYNTIGQDLKNLLVLKVYGKKLIDLIKHHVLIDHTISQNLDGSYQLTYSNECVNELLEYLYSDSKPHNRFENNYNLYKFYKLVENKQVELSTA